MKGVKEGGRKLWIFRTFMEAYRSWEPPQPDLGHLASLLSKPKMKE